MWSWRALGFTSTRSAQSPGGRPPFANPVEQRAEQVRELREIKELLKEQNELLRGGAVKATNGAASFWTPSLHAEQSIAPRTARSDLTVHRRERR